jgi:hypothetical protein
MAIAYFAAALPSAPGVTYSRAERDHLEESAGEAGAGRGTRESDKGRGGRTRRTAELRVASPSAQAHPGFFSVHSSPNLLQPFRHGVVPGGQTRQQPGSSEQPVNAGAELVSASSGIRASRRRRRMDISQRVLMRCRKARSSGVRLCAPCSFTFSARRSISSRFIGCRPSRRIASHRGSSPSRTVDLP